MSGVGRSRESNEDQTTESPDRPEPIESDSGMLSLYEIDLNNEYIMAYKADKI